MKNRQVEWNRVVINEVATGKQVLILPTGFCGPLTSPRRPRPIVTDPKQLPGGTCRPEAGRHPSVAHLDNRIVWKLIRQQLALTPTGSAVTGTAIVRHSYGSDAPARIAKRLSD